MLVSPVRTFLFRMDSLRQQGHPPDQRKEVRDTR